MPTKAHWAASSTHQSPSWGERAPAPWMARKWTEHRNKPSNHRKDRLEDGGVYKRFYTFMSYNISLYIEIL